MPQTSRCPIGFESRRSRQKTDLLDQVGLSFWALQTALKRGIICS